jgi:hypothetical protein
MTKTKQTHNKPLETNNTNKGKNVDKKQFSFLKYTLFSLLGVVFTGLIIAQYHVSQAEHVITVYKSPTCGCCTKWVEHLEQNGFAVHAINTSKMSKVKDKWQISPQLRSCHTGIVDNYVIEGHVPAADIKKLLNEKRQVLGIAVPGMPMGSPGMEGKRVDNYAVYEFDAKGTKDVFSQY